uniref:Uncharacterized protein n=4 Tax=Meloidogyne TaxID=189290 RepID=A0A914KWD6_MELIC
MSCPYLSGRTMINIHENEVEAEINRINDESSRQSEQRPEISSSVSDGVYKAAIFTDQISYNGYLQLDKLLDCQVMRSNDGKRIIPDEHLFIITHQTYELWFKQLDETKTLQIVSLLERTAKILKLLVDQILILETMSPLDFVEFRNFLTSASGFQSLQFRLLENKLGILNKNRVSYNYQHYKEVFVKNDQENDKIIQSEREPSLFILIDAVSQYLSFMLEEVNNPNQTKEERELRWDEYVKIRRSFQTITNENDYNTFVEKGERRLSHNALKGALMIYFYRDMPRFSQPYQILFHLMDIDSLLQKWRYNHLMLVQRMLGSKIGTGGSSGYMYLRSTVSDRYKVFLDLFNLSTWLIPRNYIPKLSPKMMRTLSGT